MNKCNNNYNTCSVHHCREENFITQLLRLVHRITYGIPYEKTMQLKLKT